jgi:hypothetical protein
MFPGTTPVRTERFRDSLELIRKMLDCLWDMSFKPGRLTPVQKQSHHQTEAEPKAKAGQNRGKGVLRDNLADRAKLARVRLDLASVVGLRATIGSGWLLNGSTAPLGLEVITLRHFLVSFVRSEKGLVAKFIRRISIPAKMVPSGLADSGRIDWIVWVHGRNPPRIKRGESNRGSEGFHG